MRLTKLTSHAIRILIDCARADGQLVKVAEIAGRLDITQQNVFKIVHILAKAGFIEAMRGRHGGVRLARPAKDIGIGEVVRATEVTHVEVERGDAAAKSGSGNDGMDVNQILDDALVAFVSVLDKHTLEDLAGGAASRAILPAAKARKKDKGTTRAVSIGPPGGRRSVRNSLPR